MDRTAGGPVSANTRPRQLTERERQRLERQLAYEHQPRSVRHDDLQRIARADENAMSEKTKEREATDNAAASDQLAKLIEIVEKALGDIRTLVRAQHGLDHRRYRDLDNMRRALTHLRESSTG
jgi:HSP90 family molecular chaperone